MPLDAARKTHEKLATVSADSADTLAPRVPPWLAALREADQAPRTVLRYGGAVRRFLAWYATVEQRPCTPPDLTAWLVAGSAVALIGGVLTARAIVGSRRRDRSVPR